MKRYAILALVFVASASFITAGAVKKDKKKKVETVETPAPINLTSSSDSLSYAAGMAMTNGLMPFLKQQYQFDEAYMDDFIEGFKTYMQSKNDPKAKARQAGQQIAQMVTDRMLPGAINDFEASADTINADIFNEGFLAALKNDTTYFDQQKAQGYFYDRRQAAVEAKTEAMKKVGRDFLAENATKPGVKVTPSGLQYKVITQGTGAIPETTDEVKVNYEGRLIDGTVFDSSYKRNEPATLKANQVIKGWTEALTMMPVGSKWELYIPYNLAYGERGAGNDIKPYETLIFTVELLDIVKQETKPADSKSATTTSKPAAATKKVAGKKK